MIIEQADKNVDQDLVNNASNQEKNIDDAKKTVSDIKPAKNRYLNIDEKQNKVGLAANPSKGTESNGGKLNRPSSSKAMKKVAIAENEAKIKRQEKNRTPEHYQNAQEKSNIDQINEDYVQALPYEAVSSIHQKDPRELFESSIQYKPRPSLIIYGKVSGGLMENYKTSKPYGSGLVDISLNLEMNFDGLLLRTGIGAQHTSNADLIVSQRAKVYGFGVTNHQNDLSYQSLFDLYIPLELGYKINATSFGIGAQVNYLLSTGMDLNLYENQNLVNTQKYYGSTDGLNTFSTQGYVWMEHQFNSRFSIGLKIGTNISGRIKDDAYFNQSSTTNPIYGQVSLRFNIIQ
jgi:hypothetical protein